MSQPESPTAQSPQRLLSMFPEVSYAEWRALVESELDGKPFDRTLVTSTREGIDLQPMYWAQDVNDVPFLTAAPGEAPYLRGVHTSPPADGIWQICQAVRAASAEQALPQIQEALEHGATAFDLQLSNAAELELLLQEVVPDAIGLFIHAPADQLQALGEKLQALIASKGQGGAARGAFLADPLAGEHAAADYDALAKMTSWASANAPAMATLAVDVQRFHELGASAVEELGCALASGVEHVRAMQQRGVSAETAAPRVVFECAVGTQIFMEIAKLRALRSLWAQVAEAFGCGPEAQRCQIYAHSAMRNKTLYDPHVNMLRSTAEAFAGIIGSCDCLEIAPFDAVLGKSDSFGRRIAINIQHLLNEESQLGRMVDPAGGSWYVEALTDALARRAWAFFQEIEGQGGMSKATAAGMPQARIAEVSKQRQTAIATRRQPIVGTSMYANPKETLSAPEHYIAGRDAEAYERIRMRSDAAPARPHAFLANMGPQRQHRARADFSTGFLQAGGFVVEDNHGFATPAEAAEAAIASKAPVVVICSTDPTYPELVPPLIEQLKAHNANTVCVVAGYPTDQVESLRAAGVDEFIHLRSDVPATLTKLLGRIGIAEGGS